MDLRLSASHDWKRSRGSGGISAPDLVSQIHKLNEFNAEVAIPVTELMVTFLRFMSAWTHANRALHNLSRNPCQRERRRCQGIYAVVTL